MRFYAFCPPSGEQRSVGPALHGLETASLRSGDSPVSQAHRHIYVLQCFTYDTLNIPEQQNIRMRCLGIPAHCPISNNGTTMHHVVLGRRQPYGPKSEFLVKRALLELRPWTSARSIWRGPLCMSDMNGKYLNNLKYPQILRLRGQQIMSSSKYLSTSPPCPSEIVERHVDWWSSRSPSPCWCHSESSTASRGDRSDPQIHASWPGL